MLASGLLTCTIFFALLFLQSAFRSNFGESLEGPVSDIIVRNWGALIGLMGIMLIYGAFVNHARRFVVVIAAISKLVFIILVLSSSKSYFAYIAGTAVIVDFVIIDLFAAYLLLFRSAELRRN
jgi:hypothetical protein